MEQVAKAAGEWFEHYSQKKQPIRQKTGSIAMTTPDSSSQSTRNLISIKDSVAVIMAVARALACHR